MSALNTANTWDFAVASALGNANSTAVYPCGPTGVAPSNSGSVNPFIVYCWGTFSSNTAKLQVSPDNGTTWIDYPGASFTAAGMFGPIYLGAQQAVRCSNTGGSINMTLATVF